MEERKWEELDMDCLVNVLGRLDMESLILDIPFVCKSWHKASLSPLCWQHLDFSEILAPCTTRLKDKHFHVSHVWRKVNPTSNFEDEDLFVTTLIKSVITRNNKSTVSLVFPLCYPKEALIYAAEECSTLKHLVLPTDVLLFDEKFPLVSFIRKWRNLEVLGLESVTCLEEILTQVSLHCNNFVGLDVTTTAGFGKDKAYTWFDVGRVPIGKHQASAIVTLLPNIKRLILRHAILERENLVVILQGCKQLEYFDARHCLGFEADDDEILKLASHIKTFMFEGSSVKEKDSEFSGPAVCTFFDGDDYEYNFFGDDDLFCS
ncbi:hypothetical protein F0562_013661 [Nyssa sinensis]|uniref:F-box domain-containing protein n=1 Tax=Nyssa sinensis TaxID=561372 RepID=A0A5J4ZLD4_9ASTE|nr:hypothetical protein F0562_013661 [Nyssa sinensis]